MPNLQEVAKSVVGNSGEVVVDQAEGRTGVNLNIFEPSTVEERRRIYGIAFDLESRLRVALTQAGATNIEFNTQYPRYGA
ncbi:MAG: hypothetical protein AAB853_04160 [Patescibacteria group bacterium]